MAGGIGKRLYPLTIITSKQLLPIYDKPMIYYSLSLLLIAGVRDILIISDKTSIISYEKLFSDGSSLGIEISYKIQESPKGIADGLIVARDFIADESVMFVLGDNFLYGSDLQEVLKNAIKNNNGATIFGYTVKNPSEYGVAFVNDLGVIVSIEEKPINSNSNLAIPGIYIYNSDAVKMALDLKPSSRGELEITDLNKKYLFQSKLQLIKLGRGIVWLDTGNPTMLTIASNYVEMVQNRQGNYIGCIEEIVWRMGYITTQSLKIKAEDMLGTDYGSYLISLVKDNLS